VFLEYLTENVWRDLQDCRIYFLSAMGKFNIHRYMNLFGQLGVPHSVLMDKDRDENVHAEMNAFIYRNGNKFTEGMHSFDDNLEVFLGIGKQTGRPDLKPARALLKYKSNQIAQQKIDDLRQILVGLLGSTQRAKNRVQPTRARTAPAVDPGR